MDISANDLAASLLLALLAGQTGAVNVDTICGSLAIASSVADMGGVGRVN